MILRGFNVYGPMQDITTVKLIINVFKRSLNDVDIFIFGSGKQIMDLYT